MTKGIVFTNKTIDDLNKIGYVYRHKKIVFNGGPTPATEQRKGEYMDENDIFFTSKEEFETWHKSLTANLAQLDECLNYCKHFVRTKGNEGNYVRDGKTYPVDGTWCGIHDYRRGESGEFFKWVKENWGDSWYELMDRYKNL